MILKNFSKLLNLIEITSLMVLGLIIFILIILPFLTFFYVNENKYISNSIDIELDSIKYIGSNRIGLGNSVYKDVFTIYDNDTYYDLIYYNKDKNDSYRSQFDSSQMSKDILIKVNPIELNRNQGSIENPIPIFNFSINLEDYVWDQKSYKYNVESYIVWEDILHVNLYAKKLIYVSVFFSFITLYFCLKPSSKDVRKLNKKRSRKN